MNCFKNLIVLTFTALMMNVSFAECLSWAGNPAINTSDGVTYIDFQSYPHWADGSPSVSVTLDNGSQASSSGQNANQGNNAFWYAGFTADQLASGGDNTYTVTFSSSSESGCSDFSFTGTFYTDCLGVYNGAAQLDDCGVCGGDDSSCAVTYCAANEHVVSNSCVACPAGTTNASGDDASGSDTSCAEAPSAANLFFSEYAEGSSNNKYVEIYNASSETVDLSGYAYPTVSNAPSTPGVHEYWNTFAAGATVAAGDVYVVCHGSADQTILDMCDETYQYLSNGDDGMCLVYGSEDSYTAIDCLGDFNGDPGSAWDVCGEGDTKDNTLVRNISVTSGNPNWSETSSADSCEWTVLGNNTWTYLGSHPHDFDSIVEGCTDSSACNYNADANTDDGSCAVNDCAGVCGGDAVADCAGTCSGSAVVGCDDVCDSGLVDDACGDCGGDGSACAAAVELFFSEHAEGSSSNKYFEVFNPSSDAVSLASYQFVNCANGCDDWEYTNDFASGATVPAGGTWTVCHSNFAGDQTVCDETRTLYHNGDDAQGLIHTPTSTLLDVVGGVGADPGSGWEVAGVADGTKDHTIVRKSDVTSGNAGNWTASAGTDYINSEWVVLPQNTWDYMGSHPHTFTFDCAGTPNGDAVEDCAGVCEGTAVADCAGTCGGDAVVDCAGTCGGDAESDPCGECNGDGVACSTVFNVDMNCAGTEFTTVHVTGPFCGWCGGEAWNTMSDEDGDGVYTLTLYNLEAPLEYKYMIDGFADQETLYDDMAAGASCAPITDYWSYGNRQLDAVGGGLTVSETYGSCMTCDEQAAMLVSTIDFEVDMNGSMYPNGDYDNVVLNGDWPGSGPWNGWGLQLSDDDGDGVYTGSLTLDGGTSFEYVVAVTGSAAVSYTHLTLPTNREV